MNIYLALQSDLNVLGIKKQIIKSNQSKDWKNSYASCRSWLLSRAYYGA